MFVTTHTKRYTPQPAGIALDIRPDSIFRHRIHVHHGYATLRLHPVSTSNSTGVVRKNDFNNAVFPHSILQPRQIQFHHLVKISSHHPDFSKIVWVFFARNKPLETSPHTLFHTAETRRTQHDYFVGISSHSPDFELILQIFSAKKLYRAVFSLLKEHTRNEVNLARLLSEFCLCPHSFVSPEHTIASCERSQCSKKPCDPNGACMREDIKYAHTHVRDQGGE